MTAHTDTAADKVELLRGLATGEARALWFSAKTHSLSSLEASLVRGEPGSYSAVVNGQRGCIVSFTKVGLDGVRADFAGPPVVSSRSAAQDYRERDGQFPVSVTQRGSRATEWARRFILDIQQTTALRGQRFLVLIDPALAAGKWTSAREYLDELAEELDVAVGLCFDDGACEGVSVYPIGHQPSVVADAAVEHLEEAQRLDASLAASREAESRERPWGTLKSLRDSIGDDA